MHSGKKRYMTPIDHPLFKAVGASTTLIILSVLFMLTFKGSLDMAMVILWPGVLILIWAGIKRRLFWLFWLIPTGLTSVVMTLFGGINWLVSVAAYGYWLVSTVTCLMLIFAKTWEQKRYLREKQERIENEKAYSAAAEQSALRHDASLNALLDSLGDQIPEDRVKE